MKNRLLALVLGLTMFVGAAPASAYVSKVEQMETAGSSGTAPVSDGSNGLTMTDVATQAELDSHTAGTAVHGATGAVVGTTNVQTLTNKTLTQPTIGDFTNAGHTHENTAGGGTLSGSAIASGTVADARIASTIARDTEVQQDSVKYAADAGASDAYAVTLSPAPGAYTTGMVVHFKANTANTGGATLNVNGLGATTILKHKDTALADNDIKAGQIVTVVYDGTNFQMQSELGNAPAGAGAGGWTDNGATVNATTANDNFVIGSTSGTAGTSATATLVITNGTAPTTSPADSIQIYAGDGTDSTVLMLHFDAADGSTTMTDSSASTKTVTANGNAQIDTAQSKFGGSSCLFDGTTDYLTSADNAAWDFGTSDYTIQFWVRFNSVASTQVFVDRNNALEYTLQFLSTNLINWYVGNSKIKEESWTPVTNTWYFFEMSRSGSSLRFFVDGTALGSTTSNSSNITGTSTLYIGSLTNTTSSVNGWLDDFRILNGTAHHTANYSVPTSALDNSSATSEAKVRDEIGNITTFSPHNLEGLPSERVAEIVAAGHLPMTVHHKNAYTGVEEWIDVVTLAMEVENLTGRQLVFSKEVPAESWEENVKRKTVRRRTIETLKQADPTLDVSKLTDKEIDRRAEWLAVKAQKEAEFQAQLEANGGKLDEGQLPPKWMRPLVEKAKERLNDNA